MTTSYQSGIIAEASSDALFITLKVNNDHIEQIKQKLSAIPATVSYFQQKFPGADLHAAIGIGSDIWDSLDTKRPKELTSFPHVKGEEYEVVPAYADLVLHIRSFRRDATYELTNAIYQSLKSDVSIIEEVSCFKYLDNRDLTGFVDGTENPTGDDRIRVALVGDEDNSYKGGSYLNLMKFTHDLDKWEKETLKTQEDTYGRTKYENEEYPSSEKSVHAHTKRTSIKDEHGKSREILRQSMPFASLTEKGLIFVSYSKTPEIFNLMLESMIKGDEHGHTDHLLKYTTAHKGLTFFVPPWDWFKTLTQQ